MTPDEETEILNQPIDISTGQTNPQASQDRAEAAAEILDDIGVVLPNYRLGITEQAADFVSDMQTWLEQSRVDPARRRFRCSQAQLIYLEAIQEKLEGE